MPELEPTTREEKFLNGEVGMTPITREEKILAGEDVETITRKEYFLKKYRGGGGGDVTVVPLSVTENGTYSEEGKAYSPVSVNVPLPSNAFLLKSVTTPTPIASFTDGEEMVMPSLKVAIEPQQGGSGDPSPTNIRPISGWSEANVTRTGKNLYPHNGISIYDYAFSQQIAFSQMRNPIFMKSGQKYVLSLSENITLFRMRAFDKFQNLVTDASIVNARNQGSGTGLVFYANGNFFGYNGAGTNSITTFQPTEDIWFDMTVQTTSPSQVMFEVGDTPTTYEPYAGTTYTIDLDGTRYGGKVDLVSGVLMVDRAMVDLGSLSWSVINPQNGVFGATVNGLKTYSYGDTPDMLCSIYKITPSSYNDPYVSANGIIWTYVGVSAIRIKDTAYSNATAFKTAVTGQKLVYELATPLTIQLTPTAVKSLLGTNNIWADTGDIKDAEYFSKEV